MNYELITEKDAYERYDNMLNECYVEIEIGHSRFDPADVLKELDPVAYNVGFSDYTNSLLEDGVYVEGCTDDDTPRELREPDLEICTNYEWWRVFGPLDGVTDDDDLIDEFIDEYWDALVDEGFCVLSPVSQRVTCHGWNGANTLRHKLNGVGSFYDLTDDDIDTIYEVCDRVLNNFIERHGFEEAE